jgi:hypothetical protein
MRAIRSLKSCAMISGFSAYIPNRSGSFCHCEPLGAPSSASHCGDRDRSRHSARRHGCGHLLVRVHAKLSRRHATKSDLSGLPKADPDNLHLRSHRAAGWPDALDLWSHPEGHVAPERSAECSYSDLARAGASRDLCRDFGTRNDSERRCGAVESDRRRTRQIGSENDDRRSHLARPGRSSYERAKPHGQSVDRAAAVSSALSRSSVKSSVGRLE